MAFRKTYKKRKYVGKKKFARKTFRKTSKKTTFAKAVKKVIEKSAEHKSVNFKNIFSCGSYAASGAVDINCMFNPSTIGNSQGTGQGDRIGDRIRIVKATVQGVLFPYGYSAVNNPSPTPMDVRMIYCSHRQTPQSAPVTTNFFQSGNTSFAPVGNLQDMIADVNSDVTVKYKEYKYKIGTASVDQGASSIQNLHFTNNDYKYNKMFKHDITKYMPKIVHFNDNSTTPQEKYVWFRLLMAQADGSTQPAATTCLNCQFSITLTYVDL